jgi:hypothetical protein
VLVLTACGGTSQSVSPSLVASRSPAASAAAGSPSAVAPPSSGPITSSSNLFSLLPATQPADFDPPITCTGVIGASDPVAIVQLQAAVEGTGPIVLRDYADAANPRTVCTFKAVLPTHLIDARDVVMEIGSALAVVDLPEVRYHWFRLPEGGSLHAIGPQLDRVLWVTYDPMVSLTDSIHLTTSTGDKVIATLPDDNTGRCGSPEFDSNWAEYTSSGAHMFVLDQPLEGSTSLIVVEGESTVLSIIPPSGGWPAGQRPQMALWSPTSETLYYGKGGDIYRWTPGSDPQRFLAGVDWVNPTISGDGAYLAYAVRRADNVLHDVFLVDLVHGGSPLHIGDGARKQPVFLNATQLWLKSEGDDHGCAGAEAEKRLIYDVVDKMEFNSVIYQPILVWPSTSSNF